MLNLLLRSIEGAINSENEYTASNTGKQMVRNAPPCCIAGDHPFHSIVQFFLGMHSPDPKCTRKRKVKNLSPNLLEPPL